jgi:hypothetical protein
VRRTFSGYALMLAALVLAGDCAEAVKPRYGYAGGRLRPSLRLFPPVAVRGQAVMIRVSDIDVPSLEVNVVGGTSVHGKPLRWKRLRFRDGEWRGALPLPVRRGIYPLELRVREGGRVISSDEWLLRVFARGTQSRPTFRDLPGVAAWWVRITHPGGALVATRRWRLSVDDLRDPRRHQKLVIAYTLPGRRAVNDRLGVFLTAVRASPKGRWRLLEASVAP